MSAADTVVVGRIGSPYGVQGWVHVQSYTSPPSNILQYHPWLIADAEDKPWQSITDVQCRAHKKGFVALFDGVNDRDKAAALAGKLLGVPSDSLPATADADEFYWRDLTGCTVVTQEGVQLGVVDHLLETGANDVLVVVPHTQEHNATPISREPVLIPFVAQYVLGVDAQQRVVTVAWDPDWSV